MSAHTPGPWRYETDDPGTFQVATVERFGVYSRHLEWGGTVAGGSAAGEPEADARLIAAAPELYDAAENALNVIIACCKPDDGVDDAKAITYARTMLRAALAKANGG